MKYGKIAVAAACLVTVSLVVGVRAEADWHGGGMAGGWRRGAGAEHAYMRFLEGAQLTSAQRDQMRQIIAAAWTQNKAKAQQLRTLRMQIADQLASAGTVTEETVAPLVQQAGQLREELDTERLDVAIQVRSLLTSDQLAKAASTYTQIKALRAQERALLDAGRPSAN